MGYDTTFEGQFHLDHPFTPEHKNYLQAFSQVRHMTWNAKLLGQMEEDPVRLAVGLPIGEDARYFTGQIATELCIEHPALASNIVSPPPISFPDTGYNVAPSGVPGLWCDWEPNSEGTAMQWNGGQKFGRYISWLHFLLDHFLIPWGYLLNGKVTWQGDNRGDTGIIVVMNNKVTTEARPHQEGETNEDDALLE